MGTRRSRHNKGRKPPYKEHRLTFVSPDPHLTPTVGVTAGDNSFLFSENAKALTLATASALTEPDAYGAFKSIRWAATEGQPVCPLCGERKLYERAYRRMWKCSACQTEFTVTTGTIFAARKICFRVICMAIAVTVGPDRTFTAAEACRSLTIAYKSAWDFLNRIRAAASMEPLHEREPRPETFAIGRARYWDGALYSTRTWWQDSEKDALQNFIKGGFSPSDVAPALGRSPTSIAHYARDSGIRLPKDWSNLIAPRRELTPRRIALSYPYIMTRKAEHADLLALNDLVPRAYPEHMRADICQEMMAAVLEGSVTIDEIKANLQQSAWFLKKFWMSNYEDGGRAISFQNVDDGWGADSVESRIAAKEWHHEQFAERTRFAGTVMTYAPATQVEDTWISQIHRQAEATGLSFDEAAELAAST